MSSLTSGAVHAGKQLINTEDAPAAVGAYSQAVKAGETLYVSGQVGLIPGVITTLMHHECFMQPSCTNTALIACSIRHVQHAELNFAWFQSPI